MISRLAPEGVAAMTVGSAWRTRPDERPRLPELAPEFGCEGLLTGPEAARQEAIASAERAALAGLEPPDELAAFLRDPDSGPPEGADAWLGDLACPARDALLDARAAAQAAAEAAITEPFPTGVICHDGTGPGGAGFASGSALDKLEPGAVLARALDETWQAGIEKLTDDELAGVTLAWRRCESRAVAGQFAAVAELARRREASGDRQVTEHFDDEIALLLNLTRRSGRRLLDNAVGMAELPATLAALAVGRIDRLRAEVICWETALLDPPLAAAVEQLVIEDAPALTTTKLAARLRRAVLAADPDAARRRRDEAARDARVELFDERSGTAGLAGRDLPVTAALAADREIGDAARALKASGVSATLAQLRAAVFLGLLTGQDPRGFLPDPAADQADDDREDADVTGQAVDDPEDAGSSASDQADDDPKDAGSSATNPELSRPGDRRQASTAAGTPGGSGVPALRGSVHLTLPLAAWLAVSRSPGEITGFGPASAEDCRELADWIAENPGSRWCLTLTDAAGHAVGHGCARRRPPPRSDRGGLAAWLAAMKISPVEAGTCSHAREADRYRIPAGLDHIVKIRQRTCSNPICSRPAERCDDDHTLAYDSGGRTCEDNLGPACRTDHQAKQAAGWKLSQPSPGVFVWQPPHGRRYVTTPGVYPQ